MVTLDDFRGVAEIEFGGLVADSLPLDEKLRLYLSDGSYIDLWLSRRCTSDSASTGNVGTWTGRSIATTTSPTRPGAMLPAILTISMMAHRIP